MNREIMEGLVSLLAGQTGAGEALEGIVEVRIGDPPQATGRHPCVLVSWDRDLAPEGIQRGAPGFHKHQARFLVTLYAMDIRAADAVEATVQDLLWRWDAGLGRWRGLKAALTEAQTFATAAGQHCLVRVGETRRVVRPEAGGRYSLGAAVAVLVETRI